MDISAAGRSTDRAGRREGECWQKLISVGAQGGWLTRGAGNDTIYEEQSVVGVNSIYCLQKIKQIMAMAAAVAMVMGLGADEVRSLDLSGDRMQSTVSEIVMGLEETLQLNADEQLHWITSEPSVLTVGNDGMVHAVGCGKADVIAESTHCRKIWHTTVKASPESVSFSRQNITMGAGESVIIQMVLPDDTAACDKQFSVSDSHVVEIIPSGDSVRLTAKREGTAIVSVQLYNGVSTSCRIEVRSAPETVQLREKSMTVGVGEKVSLNAILPDNTASDQILFVTDNSSVIHMTKTDGTGEFTALRQGKAQITVCLYNGVKASCQVTVMAAPMNVELSQTDIQMKIGNQTQIEAILPEQTAARQRNFRSSDEKVIRIRQQDKKATIQAVGAGTAYVTVKLYNGIEKSCQVTVWDGPIIEVRNGVTYMDGVLIVNKTYPLPRTYGKGLDKTAKAAFQKMKSDAEKAGIHLYIVSGFRSYDVQAALYQSYCAERGQKAADRFSARPGHSEHQSGLAMDINSVYDSFADTAEAKWLKNNCHRYGFIIRYPKGKESVTGYKYESWHIRYVGKELAEKLNQRQITLEEYFGIDSVYKDSDN